MVAIIGLGNPGEEYRATRHNAGFMAADELSKKFHIGPVVDFGSYLAGQGTIGGTPTMVVYPLQYMNNSGVPLEGVLERHALTPGDILVISDDIALPLGTIRVRPKGSSGGHNGLRSIIEALGTEEFPRMRLGIMSEAYSETTDLAEFVLSPFEPREHIAVTSMVQQACDVVESFVTKGIDESMSRFNT